MGFAPGPGTGNSSIAGSTDVALSGVTNNDTLSYDQSAAKWSNKQPGGGLVANGTLTVFYDNGWPERPTDRTDVSVYWIEDSVGGHGTPPELLATRDLLLFPEGIEPGQPGAAPWYAWDFESQTVGSAISPPSEWTARGGAVMAQTAAAIHGSIGARYSNLDTFSVLDFSHSNLSNSTVVTDIYFVLRSVQGAMQVVTVGNNGGTTFCSWRVTASRNVELRDGSTTTATSTETLSLSTTYRAAYKITNNSHELRVYAGENTSPLITLSGSTSTSGRDRVRIGSAVASSGSLLDIDTVRFGDEWLAPVGV